MYLLLIFTPSHRVRLYQLLVLTASLLDAGMVEVEEGEVNGQELSIASHSIARISFAKKPQVEQVSISEALYTWVEIMPSAY